MTPGKIILLNGSSSSGKTTIANMLQQLLDEPYQHIALDQFRDGMPGRFRGLNSPEGSAGAEGLNVVPISMEGGRVTSIQFGTWGRQMLRGMRSAIAAFAREGNNVIIDDLMFEQSFLLDYLDALDGLCVTFVGVRCSLDEVNRREAKRIGRFPGTAISHFHTIHRRCIYDIEIDTTTTTPRECAERILEALGTHAAFDAMRGKLRSRPG